ncbi:MAG: type II toxin-antitoxin system mRNA interferase toxin, RelE/StbE family [Candidatus Peregrinibacteria bacterium]|nr:type II toxin-antitoxin system mRNA interferase toxin, RelE/StbE family [Candidatus Peregrinibacteria bacterium]
MRIRKIHYYDIFAKQFDSLPVEIKRKVVKQELLLKENPFHPSLRLHKLRGRLDGFWSISIDMKYRLIFSIIDKETVLFHSVGVHAIYEDF